MGAQELKKKHVTKQLVWLEYREAHSHGYQYSLFCKRYAEWSKHLAVTMRQTHRAGEKMFVDFSGDGIEIVDPATSVRTVAKLFVAVLGASNLTYVEPAVSEDRRDSIARHTRGISHTSPYRLSVSAYTGRHTGPFVQPISMFDSSAYLSTALLFPNSFFRSWHTAVYAPRYTAEVRAIMRRIPIPIRLSAAAEAHLRRRTASAHVGSSSFASRFLEKALFEPTSPSSMSLEPSVDVPRTLLETIVSEATFTSAALERFIAKQPGLADHLRAEARARASKMLDTALGATSKRTSAERGTPGDERSEVKRSAEK